MNHAAWMQQAEDDLKAAKLLSHDGHHSQAIWLAGQAVEKAHKAILFALGLRFDDSDLKRTFGHDIARIAKLLPDALQTPIDPEVGRRLAELKSRVEDSRYPTVRPGGSREVVAPVSRFVSSEDDVTAAVSLVAWCHDRIARAMRGVAAMAPGAAKTDVEPAPPAPLA